MAVVVELIKRVDMYYRPGRSGHNSCYRWLYNNCCVHLALPVAAYYFLFVIATYRMLAPLAHKVLVNY